MGLDFPNPLGLAAGMDKKAEAMPGWENLGFGFIEVGGITEHEQSGNPKPRMLKSVTIYTGPLCNYCDAAKRLLTRNNVEYKEIDISSVDGAMDEMIKRANGKRTIPQIFFDDQHIGGYDETRALEKENKLQDLLK